MTLLYHFPLQETTDVSKVKGTKYSESEGVLSAVGSVTLDSTDSSDNELSASSVPVTDGIDDIVETLADLELNVTLKDFQVLIHYGVSNYSISGTFKWVAYVSGDYSSYDGTSITLQSEKNDNPIFEFHESSSDVYQYIFHHSKKWYYAHKEGTTLTNNSSNPAFWREITNEFNIESIFVPGIDTPFPALHTVNGSIITWNHDVFRVENLLARPVQTLSGSFTNASFVSFWAYINNTWTFVTFDGSSVKFNNITQTDYTGVFKSISLTPFTLSTATPLKILDLKFYNIAMSFQDIFKHPRNPSFGFFQLSHSTPIGIAGNQLDDSLTVFKHSSSRQDQQLADLRLKDIFVHGSASIGNLIVKQPKNDDGLWHILSLQSSYTEHLYISTFNTSADNSLNFGQKGEDGVFSIWRYNTPDAQHTPSTFSVDTINNLTTINSDLQLGQDGSNSKYTIKSDGGITIHSAKTEDTVRDNTNIHLGLLAGNGSTSSAIEMYGSDTWAGHQQIVFKTSNKQKFRIAYDGWVVIGDEGDPDISGSEPCNLVVKNKIIFGQWNYDEYIERTPSTLTYNSDKHVFNGTHVDISGYSKIHDAGYVGRWDVNDNSMVCLSHWDHSASASAGYCVGQDSNGDSYLNCVSQKTIYFKNGGATVATVETYAGSNKRFKVNDGCYFYCNDGRIYKNSDASEVYAEASHDHYRLVASNTAEIKINGSNKLTVSSAASNFYNDVTINGTVTVSGDINITGQYKQNGTTRSVLALNGGYNYGGGGGGQSDDRLKLNEQMISDASPLLKLHPQVYDKLKELDGNVEDATFESGLIAQEIWYDCPELRHLVNVGEGGSPADVIETSSDPSVDPDYSSWGPEPASVNYTGFIPYLIRGFQEQQAENLALKARIAALEKAMGLSGNVEF